MTAHRAEITVERAHRPTNRSSGTELDTKTKLPHMAKKRWSDLSTGQQLAIGVGGAAEVVITALALRDLARRPTSQVRGPKVGWLVSFVIQPSGPIVYFAVGRRPVEESRGGEGRPDSVAGAAHRGRIVQP